MSYPVSDLLATGSLAIKCELYPLLSGNLKGLNGPNGPDTVISRCASKPPYLLQFTTNSVLDFGFDAAVDFDINFLGQSFVLQEIEPDGTTVWSGTWLVNQPVGRDYSWNGHALHIEAVQGYVASRVTGFAKPQTEQCDQKHFDATAWAQIGTVKDGNPEYLTLTGSLDGVPFLQVFGFIMSLLYRNDSRSFSANKVSYPVDIVQLLMRLWFLPGPIGPETNPVAFRRMTALMIKNLADSLGDSKAAREISVLAAKISE